MVENQGSFHSIMVIYQGSFHSIMAVPSVSKKGQVMSKKRFYDKKMSTSDGNMLGGSGGQANMPQNVVMKNYPKGSEYMFEGLEDGMSVIDKQKSSDVSKAKSEKPDSKY